MKLEVNKQRRRGLEAVLRRAAGGSGSLGETSDFSDPPSRRFVMLRALLKDRRESKCHKYLSGINSLASIFAYNPYLNALSKEKNQSFYQAEVRMKVYCGTCTGTCE